MPAVIRVRTHKQRPEFWEGYGVKEKEKDDEDKHKDDEGKEEDNDKDEGKNEDNDKDEGEDEDNHKDDENHHLIFVKCIAH
ncbi:unnamed protein product [Didymodactylos carnosus]|uniref:Uncharacterized protein n=1 Tax=Didymodactylos carnosus TaxID=1234261 RepID=A0A8S2G0P0_9BILA|nr:unnamed protein product [Didymodactylos carnosus]CAF4413091.1 unnamed protein product [Didymodactylos carnosus]